MRPRKEGQRECVTKRVTEKDLGDLRRKYQEILRLRHLHARPSEPDPRGAMNALAAEFPGALRELDDMPEPQIVERIGELTAALSASHEIPEWAVAVSLFHRETRGALCAKRWLGGRKTTSPEDRAAFERAASDFCYVSEARGWADDLDALAAPPKGRITELVYGRIATELGLPLEATKALIFVKRTRR